MSCQTIELDSRYARVIDRHPCLGRAQHKGRLHLPVSPACNIKCRFCTRVFNETEVRPGVAREILPVRDAAEIVGRALKLCPELTVIGVAGPGDSLATDHALMCLSEIHQRFPDLIGCLSTNGLALPERIGEIVAAGVGSVTVTVNAVDPGILSEIVEYVEYGGRLTGADAAALLIERQLAGIRALAETDVLVKINTVLIPGVNDGHIGEIARVTSALGASILNVIPLIPQGDLSQLDAPDCGQLNEARQSAEEFLPVFRHCQHCRADAFGPLGEDIAEKLYRHLRCENTFSHG